MYSSFARLFRRLGREESGVTFIIIALAGAALVVAVAAGIEMSRYSDAKSQFAHALDQATLAAAANGMDNASAGSYARTFFNTNLSNQTNIKVNTFSVVANADHTQWTGDASGTIDLPFASVLGVDSVKIVHHAVVAWDDSYRSEVVAMVDVSGTMCANFKRTREVDGKVDIDFVPDRNCTKLKMMKEALKQIVSLGVSYDPAAPDPVYKVGVVPFTYKVKLPHPENVPDLLIAAERDSKAGGGAGDLNYFSDTSGNGPALPQVLSLRTISNAGDKQAFLNDVDHLISNSGTEFDRDFMKRSSLGTEISAMMLDPRYVSMFNGATPAPFGTPKTDKIVIMMTDSANLGCCFTNWPDNNYRNHYIYSYNPDHEQLVGTNGQPGLCQQMKDAGITVFTVLLDVDKNDMDARGAEIVNAFQSCATSPENAFQIPLNDNGALKTAYTTIGAALLHLRVTE